MRACDWCMSHACQWTMLGEIAPSAKMNDVSLVFWWNQFIAWRNSGSAHTRSQVLSPNTRAKPQLLSLNKPLKYSKDLCGELGPTFCSTQLSTTSPRASPPKKCCHVDIHVIIPGTQDLEPRVVWSRTSQLPCSQRLRSHGLTSNDLGLGTWDPTSVNGPLVSPSRISRPCYSIGIFSRVIRVAVK